MASLAEFLQAQQQFLNQPKATEYMRDIYESAALPSALNMKRLEERKAFEDYANTQELRKLFAQSQGMPGIAEVGQYSPDMAIKLQQAQLENLAKQAQISESGVRTGKMGQEMQVEKGKMFANAIGPFADQYFMDVQSGMQPGQALNKFKMNTGNALMQLEQIGLKPDVPFDMNTLTPDAALGAASGHGYRSQYFGIKEEAAKRQLPPAPSAENYYGGVHMTEFGPMRKPPVVGPYAQPYEVIQPSEMEGMQAAPMGAADIDNLRQMYQQAPPGPDKQRLEKMLADAVKQQLPGRGGFITPEQLAQSKAAEAGQVETAKEQAKAEAVSRESAEEKLSVISAMPSDAEIKKLLDQSIAGSPESILKGPVATALHIENKAQTASNVLASLQEFVKALAEKAKGDLNMQEVKNYNAAVGALADESLNPNSRFAAYLNAKNIITKKIGQRHPDIYEKYLGKQGSFIGSEQNNSSVAPEAAPTGKPKIGEVQGGYIYKGGDPANPSSWEKQ